MCRGDPTPWQVIAARKGEFETGFEKGGQTREHIQLARTVRQWARSAQKLHTGCGSVAAP